MEDLINIAKSFDTSFNPRSYYFCAISSQFLIYSYRRWAIKDLIETIENDIYFERHLKNTGIDPIYFMERYREKMDSFACLAKTEKTNLIFSVAYDLATDVLDELISRRIQDERL